MCYMSSWYQIVSFSKLCAANVARDVTNSTWTRWYLRWNIFASDSTGNTCDYCVAPHILCGGDGESLAAFDGGPFDQFAVLILRTFHPVHAQVDLRHRTDVAKVLLQIVAHRAEADRKKWNVNASNLSSSSLGQM